MRRLFFHPVGMKARRPLPSIGQLLPNSLLFWRSTWLVTWSRWTGQVKKQKLHLCGAAFVFRRWLPKGVMLAETNRHSKNLRNRPGLDAGGAGAFALRTTETWAEAASSLALTTVHVIVELTVVVYPLARTSAIAGRTIFLTAEKFVRR